MGLYDGLTIPQSPRAAGSEFAASDAQSLQNTINRLSSGREAPDVLKAADIENARLISQLEPVLAQPTDGGYQPNLRRGPFGPVSPESSYPGDGRVDSISLPADTVFPQASAEQIGGGITYVPEGGPDYTA